MKSVFQKGNSQAFSLENERAKSRLENDDRSIHLNRYTSTRSVNATPGHISASQKLKELNEKSNIIRQFYAKTRKNKKNIRHEVDNLYETVQEANCSVINDNENCDLNSATVSSSRSVLVHNNDTLDEHHPKMDIEDQVYGATNGYEEKSKAFTRSKKRWKTVEDVSNVQANDRSCIDNHGYDGSTQSLETISEAKSKKRRKSRLMHKSQDLKKVRNGPEEILPRRKTSMKTKKWNPSVNVGSYFSSSESDNCETENKEKFKDYLRKRKLRQCLKKSRAGVDIARSKSSQDYSGNYPSSDESMELQRNSNTFQLDHGSTSFAKINTGNHIMQNSISDDKNNSYHSDIYHSMGLNHTAQNDNNYDIITEADRSASESTFPSKEVSREVIFDSETSSPNYSGISKGYKIVFESINPALCDPSQSSNQVINLEVPSSTSDSKDCTEFAIGKSNKERKEMFFASLYSDSSDRDFTSKSNLQINRMKDAYFRSEIGKPSNRKTFSDVNRNKSLHLISSHFSGMDRTTNKKPNSHGQQKCHVEYELNIGNGSSATDFKGISSLSKNDYSSEKLDAVLAAQAIAEFSSSLRAGSLKPNPLYSEYLENEEHLKRTTGLEESHQNAKCSVLDGKTTQLWNDKTGYSWLEEYWKCSASSGCEDEEGTSEVDRFYKNPGELDQQQYLSSTENGNVTKTQSLSGEESHFELQIKNEGKYQEMLSESSNRGAEEKLKSIGDQEPRELSHFDFSSKKHDVGYLYRISVGQEHQHISQYDEKKEKEGEYFQENFSCSSGDLSVKDLSLLSASFPAMLWNDWMARNPGCREAMSEYGFDEEEAGLVGAERGVGGHQSDSSGSHNYVTVIPVEYQTQNTRVQQQPPRYAGPAGPQVNPEYEAFSRSATISREFLRERASADFFRTKDYKGSADHLDKTLSTSSSPMYYPGLAPMPFEVPQMGLENTNEKPNTNVHSHGPMGHSGGPGQPPHPSSTQTLQRRPHTPHTPHLSHSHNTAVSVSGPPHALGPHGHSHPSQVTGHSDSDSGDKKNSSKPEIDRKTKVNNSSSSSNSGGSVNSNSTTNTSAQGGYSSNNGNKGGQNCSTSPSGSIVDACVYLHSRLAIRLRLEDGMRVTARELLALIIEEEEMNLPKQAMEVFAIWMVSPLLEIQLKPFHRPLEVRRHWPELLRRFGPTSLSARDERHAHEPKIVLRRNIFFTKREEVKIRDCKILELLYEEAKWNLLAARYPCEALDYEMLAGIQARLELGPYDHNSHTPSFFRRRLLDYLPDHACRLKLSDLFSFNSKSTPEIRIIEQYRSIPNNVQCRKLTRKYLEFCWSLPYYGSAFFHGQIEVPRRGTTLWLPRPDLPVLVAINGSGVTVVDPNNSIVLLSLRYDELSWEFAQPSNDWSSDSMPCLFLQFAVVEGARRYSKVLQIFSKQAVMMDALINSFVEDIKRRAALYPDDLEGHMLDQATEVDDVLVPLATVSRKEVPDSTLSNKLDRLCLATFTEDDVSQICFLAEFFQFWFKKVFQHLKITLRVDGDRSSILVKEIRPNYPKFGNCTPNSYFRGTERSLVKVSWVVFGPITTILLIHASRKVGASERWGRGTSTDEGHWVSSYDCGSTLRCTWRPPPPCCPSARAARRAPTPGWRALGPKYSN
ncbi:FERM central domain [Trinorchestia longiramus]|nr:FERM central domain [Trinorchestia longiramus]